MEFQATVKAVRRKELPEINDEFARDLGDYQTLDELKETIRKTIFASVNFGLSRRRRTNRRKLVDTHSFPVPEVFVDRQIEAQLETQLGALAPQGIDPAVR